MNMMSVIAPGQAAAATGRPWWSRTSTMLVLMILSTVPLWFVTTPPLVDFVGHMARYHVTLDIDHNPELAKNWSYHWALIGNLGVDLLILPFARLIGVEPAGWLIAAALPPLMIWGIFRTAKAVYGAVPPTVIATMPFALAYPYQYGLVNYWLGSALAFHAFASWVQLQDRVRVRSIIFVPIGFAIWVCHVYGWAIFAVLVGGYELSCALKPARNNHVSAMIRAGARTWPLLTVIVAMVIWRSNGQGAETLGWFDLPWKISAVLLTLRDQWKPLDIGSLVAAMVLIYFGFRDKRATIDPRFGWATAMLAVALLIIPYQLFGSAFADARVYPFLFIAAILSIRLPADIGDRRLIRAVSIGFAALFVVRIAFSAIGYAQYDTEYKRHLQALDHIERGASVAVVVALPCDAGWRHSRVDHLGSMALLRRDAFVNSQWDVPGAELLRAKRAIGTGFTADPSQYVFERSCKPDLRPALARRLAKIPRRYFDYIWVFKFDYKTLPNYPNLTQIYHDESTILYRIEPDPRSTKS